MTVCGFLGVPELGSYDVSKHVVKIGEGQLYTYAVRSGFVCPSHGGCNCVDVEEPALDDTRALETPCNSMAIDDPMVRRESNTVPSSIDSGIDLNQANDAAIVTGGLGLGQTEKTTEFINHMASPQNQSNEPDQQAFHGADIDSLLSNFDLDTSFATFDFTNSVPRV